MRLCKVGDWAIAQVARDLDLTETALREWVKRAVVDAGEGPPDALATDERTELRELQKRVKRFEMEREISKKAAAHSAGRRNTARDPGPWRVEAKNLSRPSVQSYCNEVEVLLRET